MNLSYWEQKTWFSDIDFTVVGSGIVGLFCALRLKTDHPTAKIVVIDRGSLPKGASTKNAGFACFGSLSELLSDLQNHSEQEVYDLVSQRWSGLKLLRETLGDAVINYKAWGGYELFNDTELFEQCKNEQSRINALLAPLFKKKVFSFVPNTFGFKNTNPELSFNAFEAQIDTGKMMQALIRKAQSVGIILLQGIEVQEFDDLGNHVEVKTSVATFKTKGLFLATNGFANELLDESIQPARAQVLITKPISGLTIKGTFHLEGGYYYFRNIDDRILFGGGRNIDFKGETTTDFGQTKQVQTALETLLSTSILPDIPYEIESRWSGIMGVGPQKKALVKPLSENVFCGVRLGGMGVAIGSSIGNSLAKFVS